VETGFARQFVFLSLNFPFDAVAGFDPTDAPAVTSFLFSF